MPMCMSQWYKYMKIFLGLFVHNNNREYTSSLRTRVAMHIAYPKGQLRRKYKEHK